MPALRGRRPESDVAPFLPFDSFFYFRYLCFTTFRQSPQNVNRKVALAVETMQRRSVLKGAALLAAISPAAGFAQGFGNQEFSSPIVSRDRLEQGPVDIV